MTLEEIFELWEVDARIEIPKLSEASLDTTRLHHKYYSIFSRERLLLRKLESDMKVLRLEKTEFYVDGPTQEQLDRGWLLPPKGRILKSDASNYIDADSDIISLNLKIAYQQEKINLLESIIRFLQNRGFQIKNAIDFEKFKVGG